MEMEKEISVSEVNQNQFVTTRELSESCSCSKPTVRKVARDLDPDGTHRHKEGNAEVYDQWLASAIADEVPRRKEGRRGPGVPVERLAARDGELDAVRDALARERKLHDEVTAQYEARIAELYTEVAYERDRAERERTRADEGAAQVERLRTELARAMALEGFHFPWQRASIIRRYALPESTD